MINLVFKLRNWLDSSNFLSIIFRPLILFVYRGVLLLYGSSVPLNAKFKGVPVFPHSLYGIFISGDAVIGDNVTIFQQVTIGSVTSKGSKNQGSPKIGSGVVIGAGAKIIGGIVIGNNVKIGANCVVVQDVPDGATVVLSPSRVILK